jgi:hypothetical protein
MINVQILTIILALSHLQIFMLSDIIPNVVVLSMVYAESRIFIMINVHILSFI